MKPAFHTMIVSVLTGIFSLTVLGVALRLYIQRFKPDLKDTVGKYADFMAWLSALIGFLMIFAALVTGFSIWPKMAVLNSSILKNKIFTSVLLLIFWGLFLYIRYRYRKTLWENTALSIYYSLLGLGAFFWGIVTNSIGGDVAGNSSGFEYLVRIFTVDTRWTFYLPNSILIVIVGLGVLAAVLPLFMKSKDVGPSQFNETSK